MSEDLSFCDRERALRSMIIKTVFSFAVVKKRKRNLSNISVFSENAKMTEVKFKGAVSRNSAKSGYYKMPVKLKET